MDLRKKLYDFSQNTEHMLPEIYSRDYTGKEIPFIPEPGACALVPAHLAREYNAIPVRVEGHSLIVAMSNPGNVIAIDNLRLLTGMEIKPVQADQKFIDTHLHKIYGAFDIIKACENFVTECYTSGKEQVRYADPGNNSEAPVIKLVNSLIERAVNECASDIHLEPKLPGLKIRFRVDGFLRDIMTLPPGVEDAVVSRIKIMSNLDIAEKRLPQDGRIQFKMENRNVDLRVSTIPTVFGEKVVIRLLDPVNMEKFTIDNLGFSQQGLEQFKKMLMHTSGMLLIAGPTGCGKTTTLYALLKHLNRADKNIVTVEDPVEYVLEDVNQIQVNYKTGLTFATGLRSILRQDPDIIMVGEIRDAETASIAVRAATTGHLVLSTLHTGSATEAVTRLLDMGVEPYLLASSLIGVVAQRLVRLVCPGCRQEYVPVHGTPEKDFISETPFQDLTMYMSGGCSYCDGTGYRGRMAIHEILPITPGIRKLILVKANSSDLMSLALNEGMVPLKHDGLVKAAGGLTTVHEVMRVAYSG